MPTLNGLSRSSGLILLIACGAGSSTCAAPAPDTIRVMSFNMWHGGDAGRQPFARTVALVKESGADIVGLQETAGFGPRGKPRPDRAVQLAKALGWQYLDQGGRTGIITRFKLVSTTPRKWGARVQLPSGRQFYLFNAHFAHAPYQPYQLLRIPYGKAPFLKTADEAVKAARAARSGQVGRMLAEVKAALPAGLPAFVTGDFNEPSHLDWTAEAARAKLCPLAVAWPTTGAVVAAGFQDAYRRVYPDPVKHRGLTWTPTTKVTDPKDRHDRIDFVFVRGAKARVKGVNIVGESRTFASIVVDPYPSDHRAVVATVELGGDVPASRAPAK